MRLKTSTGMVTLLLCLCTLPVIPRAQGGTQSEISKAADAGITEQIHQKVAEDEHLSANAKGVSVFTFNGSVTLRGKVNTVQERRHLESIARSVIGVTRVENQLVVSPQ
jgi:osmotically-inducible protein OsmY